MDAARGQAPVLSSAAPAIDATAVRHPVPALLSALTGRLRPIRKRLLFWKILFGFWLTFILIVEGVWATIAFYDQPFRPYEIRNYRIVGMARLDQAQTALRYGGEPALRDAVSGWPADQQRRLRREPGLPGVNDIDREMRDNTGRPVHLWYDAKPLERKRPGPFDMPKEMVWLGILGGLLFSAALAWYLTRPVQRLRRGFERLAKGDLDVRLRPGMGGRRDEIADLAEDFDVMAERLQQLVAAREQLLHDVSHELRSPLARLHLAAGLARQNPQKFSVSLDRIEFEAKRIDAMVGELLTLSRVESGAPPLEDYFDIDGLVLSVVEDARFEAQLSGIRIVCNIAEAAEAGEVAGAADDERRGLAPTVKGNAELMRRALENVVRNALRFSSSGQQVEVTVTTQDCFAICVCDQGPGMAQAGLATMFEPFVRGGDDTGETGFGLGLAIAQRAVLAHGGTIAAANIEAAGRRQGLAVTIRLPFSNAVDD